MVWSKTGCICWTDYCTSWSIPSSAAFVLEYITTQASHSLAQTNVLIHDSNDRDEFETYNGSVAHYLVCGIMFCCMPQKTLLRIIDPHTMRLVNGIHGDSKSIYCWAMTHSRLVGPYKVNSTHANSHTTSWLSSGTSGRLAMKNDHLLE